MSSTPEVERAAPAGGGAPHVLVVEDDPVSCRFLADGLAGYGARITTRSHGADALALARTSRFDLLLLDCHLPELGAAAIARALRADPAAASGTAALVATSAAFAPGERAALLAAGCVTTLDKPCTLADLRALLALAASHRQCPGVLDDAAGYRSCGDDATLRALRRLLAAELVTLLAGLDDLASSPAELAARMHRLRAACGFCGAAALAAAASAVEAASDPARGTATLPLARLRAALRDTLAAMEATDSAA